MSLSDIKRPIEDEMSRFEPYFSKELKSPNYLCSLLVSYLWRRKGKQVRPMLVFLSAKAVGGVTDASMVAATLIELLHTATIVHDDVVDETFQRRGQFSINAIWNSKIAVLVGDYMLARGLQVAVNNNQFEVLKVVSKCVQEISEGELEQIEHANRLDITEETYYEVIRKKTATLIAACTTSGAISAGASPEQIEALHNFGMNAGIAFQIRDDIFDYEKSSLLGKPSGNDIKERKMTLPLIYALAAAPKEQSHDMLRLIRRHYKRDSTVAKATAFVAEYGGIEYARKQMSVYSDRAKAALSIIPESEAKTALIALVDYNLERKK